MTATERSRSSAIRDFLAREIALGSFPGAAWAVGTLDGGIVEEGAVGHAVVVPLRIPATVDTIWDCASLTKPLVTTLLALQRFALDDVIHGYTVRELLTHTSGLRAWLPLYAYPDYINAILDHGPQIPRGSDVIYSDLNFVLLWSAMADYVPVARERALAGDACLLPPPELKPRIAATEFGQRWEAKMANAKPAREGLIWGQTHDGNSHFAGGTAGNAGLFATARDVFAMAQRWTSLLPPDLAAGAIRNHTPNMSDSRALGWQKPTGSEATKMLSPDAYGHTGFTGTSVWIDQGRIFVLLTNRVHPCAAPVAMQRIRGEFHRIAHSTFAPFPSTHSHPPR